VQFSPELSPSLWSGGLANLNGFQVAFPSVVNVLNAFNQPAFIPVGQVGSNTSINAANGTNVLSNYEVTQLGGQNSGYGRLVELVTRFNW
jgi:hypothetical protein